MESKTLKGVGGGEETWSDITDQRKKMYYIFGTSYVLKPPPNIPLKF